MCDLRSSEAGTARGIDYVYRFPRDENGAIDLKGKIKNDDPTTLKVKYDQEVRLALGVFLFEHPCGKIEGRRIKAFSYTNQTIVTQAEWERKIQHEITRVRKLKGDRFGNKAQWTVKTRNDRIFSKDKVSIVKGIGPAMEKKLNEKNIFLVEDLIALNNNVDKKNDAIRTIKGLSAKLLANAMTQLQHVVSGECPPDIDHTKEANPYESLFGDSWLQKISQSVMLSPYTSINELITHIFTETQKAFVGSKHADSWKVYHDALKLMMGAEAVEFMKTKGWYERLITPQLDLNKGTIYANRTIGCRPEMQPLDYHLNEDIHSGVQHHCIITRSLNDDDPLKFSCRTPKLMLS